MREETPNVSTNLLNGVINSSKSQNRRIKPEEARRGFSQGFFLLRPLPLY